MIASVTRRRGSGLIVVLAMLAMLAVMATTFVMLMRLDVRIVRNYSDDQQCEMLAYGVVNYFKAILRDDLDRTWVYDANGRPYGFKYENRDVGVGYVAGDYMAMHTGLVPPVEKRIPGLVEYAWGTPGSNDYWLSTPRMQLSDMGNIYSVASYGPIAQGFFTWTDSWGAVSGIPGRHQEAASKPEFEVWVGRLNNHWNADHSLVVTNFDHRAGDPIDDDMDGTANPPYSGSGTGTGANNSEDDYPNGEDARKYFDYASMIIASCYAPYLPGPSLTGFTPAQQEKGLPGGLYWRFSGKIGPPQAMYANINMAGNLDGRDTQWLSSMAGVSGITARRAPDEAKDTVDLGNNRHLGRIEWEGFPENYNAVAYHPNSMSLERLFSLGNYAGSSRYSSVSDLQQDREKARQLIRHRWGGNTPGGGGRFRVGWRRDGASYFRFPSPENPQGDEQFFGTNEVLEHDHSLDHPGTSDVAPILGDDTWREIRPYVGMWSTDTILRGKVFPNEDWRSIDVLKRVNINLLGAKSGDRLSTNNDTKADYWVQNNKPKKEQDRLYNMLVSGLTFYQVSPAQKLAAQFVASLTDMVDWDQDETCYVSPDGAVGALGYEKHPVINEVSVYFSEKADTPNYLTASTHRMRIELYNPAENIPWIPDDCEAYDVGNYVLEVGSGNYFQLADLCRYGAGMDDNSMKQPTGHVGKIGATGMYADTSTATWDRLLHIGWPSPEANSGYSRAVGEDWPDGLSKTQIEAGIEIALWKRLYGDAEAAASAGRLGGTYVRQFSPKQHGQGWYLKVDTTETIKLIYNYPAGMGPGFDTTLTKAIDRTRYTGNYRRWDPMNAKMFMSPALLPASTRNSVAWAPGYKDYEYPTLGRPNTGYPGGKYTTPLPANASYRYYRGYERNVKVVDGDLPSIAWLGELMMWDRAVNGPETLCHASAQNPSQVPSSANSRSATVIYNQLDLKAKFDLFRPFIPAREYDPDTSAGGVVDAKCLHMLDMFTVWDPSNDGFDNDGDGAIDDDDTGCQPGDKGGPEVRVFGLLDINGIPWATLEAAFPDNARVRGSSGINLMFAYQFQLRRFKQRFTTPTQGGGSDGIGDFETIGDFLRADSISRCPGESLSGQYEYRSAPSFQRLNERGGCGSGDDDGDDIYDERDERDMTFGWISNFFTTRNNVFSVTAISQLCSPPVYKRGTNGPLPFKSYRSSIQYAKKQAVGILDRSTCLRIRNGRCDFTGPVDVRTLRISDDLQVY